MNKTEDIFNKAKNEVQKLWDNQNELSDFVKFPDNLILKNIKSKKVPITNRLLNWKNNINTNHKDVHLAISALSPYAKWEQGYDEKDVGNDFLNKYGFFELIGPTGHYETSEMALYVNFLDKNADWISVLYLKSGVKILINVVCFPHLETIILLLLLYSEFNSKISANTIISQSKYTTLSTSGK